MIFTGITETSNKDEISKPTIRPNVKYLVFQPGSTFELNCESKRSIGNVTWQLPDDFRIPPAAKTLRSTTTWGVSSANNGILVATLTVSNATYADTGYYTCHYVEDASALSEQFVFIPGMQVMVR